MFRNLKIIVFLILLIGVFVVLNLSGFTKNIKNFFYSVSSPIQKTLWQAGKNTSDFFSGIIEIKTLKKELDSLYTKNQELLGEIVVLKELKKENETLKEALDIELQKDFQLKIAQLIGKDISQDSILLDKGQKDGILKGMPVVTSQKMLLGRIGEVYDNFSEVILISNKQSSFDAKISEKEIFGVVRGKGNQELYLDLIPKEKEVSKEDLVITAALGGIFPQGLLVGKIKDVRKTDIEPFQTAEIEPEFNLKNLDYLFIITDF
ncbi:MAG: rod shape-determining protein MreC [Candidatus Pacebacteria bacterium]|nr:rod shape-determining protein MreC [Candidatus Paceibacterota bacterium]